jgi:hypothetical protein
VRTFNAFLIVVAGLISTSFAGPHDKVPDKVGEADDDHGNVKWVAKASWSEKEQNWEYARFLTNRDEARRCRVAWKFGKERILTTLPPASPDHSAKRVSVEVSSDGSKDVDGTLEYNGGLALGDAKKEASVWSGKRDSSNTKSITGSALLGFVSHLGDAVEDVEFTCSSNITQDSTSKNAKIEYTIRARHKLTHTAADAIRIRWIAGDGLEQFAGYLKGAKGYEPECRAIKIPDGADRLTVFQSDTVKKTQLQAGAIQIIDRKSLSVLAEAPMAVLFPAD